MEKKTVLFCGKTWLWMSLWAILVAFAGSPGVADMQIVPKDDEPAAIRLDPIAAINPVKSQHTLVATVLDNLGRPVPGQRVDWILAPGPHAVGEIVEHDDMGAIIGGTKEVVRKSGNHYPPEASISDPIVPDVWRQRIRAGRRAGA
jgi:hypothetical protein